jgi:hypothetical protein
MAVLRDRATEMTVGFTGPQYCFYLFELYILILSFCSVIVVHKLRACSQTLNYPFNDTLVVDP